MRKLLLLALLVAGCGGPTIVYDPANYAKEYDPRKHEYIIGVSDGLQITVWRNPDLSAGVTVRPDGTVTMPLIGDLKVAGSTPSQVKAEVTQKLSAFVKDESAVVTVAVTGVNSYRFTVAEAIAMAGGPTRFADTDQILLVRTDPNGRVRQIPINYEAVRSRAQPEQDLVLMTGDTVFLP